MPTETNTGIGFHPAGNQVASRKGIERVADIDPRLTRSYYFDNRLLTEKDLNRDQQYLDGRLREMGQVLGYGVLRGLEIDFDELTGLISVAPGVGISEGGRVLELGRSLSLDLGDRALIKALNDGRYRRLPRNLYAVVIQYAEQGTDVAEVFPTDLAEQRGFNFDLISEGVQLTLVPIPVPLAQQSPLQVRANLMASFYGDNKIAGVIPEDGVALGVIAISDDRPQWIDPFLLRQPLRATHKAGDPQRDLHQHYEALFNDVMDYRSSASLTGDFAVTDYFRLIPPVGSLPKASMDPENGRQGFFPENYQVSVAPIRRGELELIKSESMVLPAINLSLDEPQDIVVLAPLSNTDYGRYGQQLQRSMDSETRKFPSLDLLSMRLYPKRPVHELDTDRSTWQSIWNAVNEEELIYIRRPLRTAETRMSGIVLAQGVSLPATPPPTEPTPSPADGGLLQDEDSVLLNRFNLSGLNNLRNTDTLESQSAAEDMLAEFGQQAGITQQAINLSLRIERQYDGLLWQTLLSLSRNEQLAAFSEELISLQNDGNNTAAAIEQIGASFGLDAPLVNAWGGLAN